MSISQDQDIYKMDHFKLQAEILKLRQSIRQHRDQMGDDRCWMDDLLLYASLPDPTPLPTICQLPERSQFLNHCSQHCSKFWDLRQPHPGERPYGK